MAEYVMRNPVDAIYVDSGSLEAVAEWVGERADVKDGRVRIRLTEDDPDDLLVVRLDSWLLWLEGCYLEMPDEAFLAHFEPVKPRKAEG
jgi:hypothetical protein